MWVSTEKMGDNTIRVTAVHRYPDEEAAHECKDEILQLLRQALGTELKDVQVEHEGEFVKLTAKLTIEDHGQKTHQ